MNHVQLTCQHTDGDLALVAVTGELTHTTAPLARAQALDLVAQGHHHLILDMGQVTFCDSAGFSALVGIWRCAREADGSLVLAAAPDRLVRMLYLTGLDELLHNHPTLHDALAAHAARCRG
ncbi:STAS domain-containing protein [Streptomyces sp. NPDC058812]|uniref:STAS domain-containing protein n=1 Tax=unclassified Streptomyces TaxID=2593676 RepID=UPI0036983A95